MKKFVRRRAAYLKMGLARPVHGIRATALISIMLMVGLLGKAVSPVAHAQSNSSDWQVRLEKVRIANADEDDFWSDGDEPYFIVIGFRSTFLQSGSTDAFWGRYLYEVHDGADDGDQAYIHNRMGVVSFPDVEIVTLNDIASGTLPELLGVVVIAMESDATPFDNVRGLMNNVENTLEQELKKLVEQGQLNLNNPQADLIAAMERIKSSAIPKGLDALWLGLLSGGDPDDVVGVHVFMFAAVDGNFQVPPLAANITAGPLSERSYRIGGNPLVFSGNGSTFEVSTSVDRLSHYGVNLRPMHSGKCIDIHAPQWTENGARVQQWQCLGAHQANQLFTLIPAGDGYYQITGTYGNDHKCLDVKDDSNSNGATVHQWECRGFGKDNQLWRLHDMGDGYYQIISKSSGRCLDVAWENVTYVHSNGARIQQWECYGGQNQLWKVVSP